LHKNYTPYSIILQRQLIVVNKKQPFLQLYPSTKDVFVKPNNKHQLYFSTTSPYARKVRIAAHEKQVVFEAVLDVPWNEDTKTIAINPLGKVPVWVMPSGVALFDSRVIVEYLDGISPVGQLFPLEFTQRIAAKRLEALADGVMDASLCIFAERRKRPEVLQYPEWIERQMSKIHRSLSCLSEALSEKNYFIENSFGVVDLSVVSALGYIGLRFSDDFSWQEDYPALACFYQRMMQKDSVNQTIPVL
jgi:glutathione S-transferase